MPNDTYIPQIGDYFFAENNRTKRCYYAKTDTVLEDKVRGFYIMSEEIDQRSKFDSHGTFYFRDYSFTKLPSPHNPDNLTEEQLDSASGWRFLDEDEIELDSTWDLQRWEEGKWITPNRGNSLAPSYRTKLTRKELRKLRNLEPKEMKELRVIPVISFSSGELALLVAYWLKEKGYTIGGNIPNGMINNCPDTIVSIRSVNGELKWTDRGREANHFTSFVAFTKWYETPEITIPNFGQYDVSVSKVGVKVGCTEVDFEIFDKIVVAIMAKRNKSVVIDLSK